MNKIDLKNERGKYVYLAVECKYINHDFEKLMEYIGKNYGRYNYRYEANAYKTIRERSDEILQKTHPKNVKIKTSKREIQSIRRSYNNKKIIGNKYYIRVPYKISYIFKAIVELINEIDNSISFDEDLRKLKGMDYGTAFYVKYIDTYNDYYQEIDNRYKNTGEGFCDRELKNDFDSSTSVFKEIFL